MQDEHDEYVEQATEQKLDVYRGRLFEQTGVNLKIKEQVAKKDAHIRVFYTCVNISHRTDLSLHLTQSQICERKNCRCGFI